MKDPAFLFYSSDFLSGTMLMTDEEVGQYIKLLCLQHQKGHLKEKDMLNICKTYNEDIFSKFKKDEEGNYYNERLEHEANKRKAYSESRRNNRNKVDNSNTNVYLIKDTKTGLIKIGSSNNPERRLVELKNQYENDDLVLVAYVENVEQKLETEIHNNYKNQNKINEWFELSNEDVQEIIERNHMKKHMNNHMNNHMIQHMGNENININKNIIDNKDNRKRGSKGKKEEEKIHFAEFVSMTNAEYEKLVSTYGKEFADQCIKKLDDYKGSSGKTYKSDYRAIGSWVVDEVKKKQSNFSKGGINDFKELMEEARNEQRGNNTSNNSFGW